MAQNGHGHLIGETDNGVPVQTLFPLLHTELIRAVGFAAPDPAVFYDQVVPAALRACHIQLLILVQVQLGYHLASGSDLGSGRAVPASAVQIEEGGRKKEDGCKNQIPFFKTSEMGTIILKI